MKNIILIGFMGVGKGRTARALSQLTGRFTIDTDDLIESQKKKKIRAIFDEQGEQAFRKMEKDVSLWIENSVNNTIISTGGGFFQVDRITHLGTVIYLHAEVEQILKRLLTLPNAEKKIKKRPLLQDLDKAKELFAQRLPKYREIADLEINVAGKSPEQIALEINKSIAK